MAAAVTTAKGAAACRGVIQRQSGIADGAVELPPAVGPGIQSAPHWRDTKAAYGQHSFHPASL